VKKNIRLKALGAALTLLSLAACAPASISWTEEVDVTGVGTIMVERYESYTATRPMGGVKSVWIERSVLRIADASVTNPPGPLETGEFMVRLDFDPQIQQWYAITNLEECRDALKFGLNSRPYFEYRWTGTEWTRAPVSEERVGSRSNLLLSKSLARKSQFVRLSEKKIADQNVGLADRLRQVLDRVPC
jgi:hypothetical protein